MMNRKTSDKLSSQEQEKLEKYIKAFIGKVPQVIVQSRCGEKRRHKASNSCESDIFEIAIEDNPDIQVKVKEACSNIFPLHEFSLCIQTLLKTAEGDTLVLESWTLRLVQSATFWDPKYRVYADTEIVISNLMMLLKSMIVVTRSIPAFKLSLGQSAMTYVILYRIYPGDPQMHQLGNHPQVNKIGEVFTPLGTLSVLVAYRLKAEMTIAPQNPGKENSFMVNSDYFNLDMSPKKTSSAARMIKNRVLRNSQSIGAFAVYSHLPDASFPELAFLQKTILHPSRSCINHDHADDQSVDNEMGDMNFNRSVLSPSKGKNKKDVFFERLSCSDVSDGSDFVLIDTKPPFAHCDPDTDLNEFYKECQSAPTLASFSSSRASLQEQVLDLTGQLEKFEMSMMGFDHFVDSVCQVDSPDS